MFSVNQSQQQYFFKPFYMTPTTTTKGIQGHLALFCLFLCRFPDRTASFKPSIGFGIGRTQNAIVTPTQVTRGTKSNLWISRSSSWDHGYNEEADTSEDFDVSKDFENDWWQAELTLLNAPSKPNPNLSAETVAINCIRSLQWVDYPEPNEGLKRCFDFLTYGCREIVTGRRGGKDVTNFVHYGLHAPALQPFMGASRVELGECTYTPAKAPLRGALASFPVQIYCAPVLAVQHLSGMQRGGIADPPVIQMVIRLEQQRRPPNQDCWLISEILDVRMAFAGDMGNAHVGG